MKLAIGSISLALVLSLGVGCKKKADKAAPPPSAEAIKLGELAAQQSGTAAPSGAAPSEAVPSGGTPSARSGGLTVDQACEQSLVITKALAAVASENKGKCDAMGAAMDKVMSDNKPLLDQITAMKADAASKQAVEQACKAQIDAVWKDVEPHTTECASNPGVTKALGSL
ncbi:MAG: hypothetical protein AB7P03_00190 [Kofleriaceae bacterium]